jgi:hypothetical protein
MMSEQTANLCTTDACESLRARLAKYEDAEGRPVSTIAEQALEIDRLEEENQELLCKWGETLRELDALKEGQASLILVREDYKRQAYKYRKLWSEAVAKTQPDPWQASGADWFSSIHRNPDAKAWADFFVAVFPGQADKHELMIGWFANAMMAMHDHLKNHPSGVVLPERMTLHGSDGKPTYETKAHNACLDEVARLNSSPVSSAPTHGDGMCNADNPGARCICREEFGHRVCAPSHGEQALYTHPADQVAEPDAELVSLLRECRTTFEMWKDVAPAVSLCKDLDAKLAILK